MPTNFQDLRHLGDELEDDLRSAYFRMIGAAKDYEATFAGTPDLLQLIQSGNTGGLYAYAERLLSQGLIPNSLDFLNIMYLIMLRSGVETVIATTALDLPIRTTVLDAVKRNAFMRSQEGARQWVTGVSRETVTSMRFIMDDALKRGVGTSQLGRELRGSVGILETDKVKHLTALRNYRTLLQSKVVDETISEAKARQLGDMYQRRLLAWRANMIARTETMYAVHAGQMVAWQQLVRAGIIQENRTWIEWVIHDDDRLCSRCAPLEGERIKFGGKFKVTHRGFPIDKYPDGKPGFKDTPYDRRMNRRGPLKPIIPKPRTPVKKKKDSDMVKLATALIVPHPPLHPMCRCSMRLVFDT